MDFRVRHADPYQDRSDRQANGCPDRGLHSVQVEISRALYLDQRLVVKSHGFSTRVRNLDKLTTILTAL
jgi:N-formylglutamate amidohydrolase